MYSPGDLVEDPTSPLEAVEGSRYTNLYRGDSFAVLLSEEALLQRFSAEAELAGMPEAERRAEYAALRNLGEQFYVFELHLRSAFGDLTMADDAVSLRGMRVVLADDTGKLVASAARHRDEEQSQTTDTETLNAVNVVLFPKQVAITGRELIQPSTQRVTLMISGLESRYESSWLLGRAGAR